MGMGTVEGGTGMNGNGGGCGSGQPRKDHFLHPISSDFDLYSMGADGQSVAPLTAQKSRDDIIRANDGSYYGLASNF
jgi:general secretion pathway protein G